MDDNKNNLEVMCCICGMDLTLDNAIHLTLTFPKSPEETQGLYCHPVCLDKVLHTSVPRHPDIMDK